MQNCILSTIVEYKEIVIALIAVIGVFFTARTAWKNNNKNLLIKTVTDERSVWRKELREICAEFVKLIYEQVNNSSVSNKPRINELKVHMKLRVNPSQEPKHKLDKEIIRLSQDLVSSLDADDGDDGKENIYKNLVDLEGNIQKLLKQEWDKSKKEAVEGKLGK
jgi:uncharacterized membrane-anchored protein YjiN (DUF445 family)